MCWEFEFRVKIEDDYCGVECGRHVDSKCPRVSSLPHLAVCVLSAQCRPWPSLVPMSRTEVEHAPTFTVKPRIKEEDDGNRLVFECELDSIPQPDVQWFKNEVLVVEGDDDRVQCCTRETKPHHYLVTLQIDDVIEIDSGVYRVFAKNLSGEVSASIRLNFDRK